MNTPPKWKPGFFLLTWFILSIFMVPTETLAVASNNIPLDSPVYAQLEKLASFGLITSDFRGIRPLSKAEAARLLAEAEKNRGEAEKNRGEARGLAPQGETLVDGMIRELERYLEREVSLRERPENAPGFAATPLSSFRVRYVYLDGVPRSYERPVHDPGGDGIFGIGAGLRPDNPFPSPAQQHGSEGTPLLENSEGITYARGSNFDLRFTGEAFAGRYVSALVEPMFLYAERDGLTQGRINKGYVKLGGGGLELEAGRDANWLGLGERGNITLTNNAVNFDLVKLSSPEPVSSRYLWDLKYALIFSRLDRTATDGKERRPYFLAGKLSFLPNRYLEFGLNLGKEFGGPGVENSLGAYLRGIVGGTSDDNANNLGGLEMRLRLPFLRNTELYGEFSGEDAAKFWPIVESYVAGVYIPRLTASGRDDLRFEYFLGNQILYTSGTFPEGYIYRGMPIGHSQGGAAEDFFLRYSHWFSVRNRLALDYIHTERGNLGRVPVNGAGQFDPNGVKQAVERKNAWRAFLDFPILERINAEIMYGWERIDNFNLSGGVRQTNQLVKVDISYRY